VLAHEWRPISPDELKMTSLAEAPGVSAVSLYRQVDREDGSQTNTSPESVAKAPKSRALGLAGSWYGFM
jgi:hypothetical protein